MTEEINIFDPKSKPFGWLSNNYRHFMKLDNKEWRTVTNYIYANILITQMHQEEVRLIKKTKDIKPTFQRLYQVEIDDVVRKSIEKALKVKFENKDLAEKLLATGNAPIFYVSQNKLLGIGPKNDGQNLYGKYLVQARHILRVSFKKQKKELQKSEHDQIVYDTYIAQHGLTDAIRKGNDLKEFVNKTPSEIIERLGRAKLEKSAPRRVVILEMVHKKYVSKDFLVAVEYPETMVLVIRKNEMRKLRLRKIKERKEIIFDMYTDYLLEKYYPELDADNYVKAKEQQLNQMGWQQKNDLQNRLYELFEKGMLSSRLSDAVDERLASHYVPSESEVEEAENASINYTDKPLVPEAPYVPEKGDPILVYPSVFPNMDQKYVPYVEFSPISITGMLNIDGKSFPTITHYISCRLIAHIQSVRFDQAYSQLLAQPDAPIEGLQSFVSPDTVNLRYEKLKNADFHAQLQKYARLGLNQKFEDRVLQDILLMTGKVKLVYNDFSDPILGVGGKGHKGADFVGKHLMTLRSKYFDLRKGETIQKLHAIHITTILDEDPFMKEWVYMRVRDMCKVLTVMKNYLYARDEIDTKLNAKFTEAVLDKIYQPCSQVYGAANLISAQVPQYFRFIVQDCPGFGKVGHDTIEVIWKRIAVIIYYLIKHLEESTLQNIRAVLGRIELMVTKGGKCIDIIPDDYDNCIVSALINLLRGISEFNKQFSYNSTITDRDVKTAASIILNSDVSDEIKPMIPDAGVDNKPAGWVGQDIDLVQPEGGDDGGDDEFIFPDDDDGDGDYGIEDGEGEDLNPDDDGFSPSRNMIVSVLRENDDIKDPENIALVIEGAVETIKTHPMSKQVKRNRINFFATQR
jgi:predicted NAD-dependent protein-ADP-ribosyltransferase YbiA (DUF1768 family)